MKVFGGIVRFDGATGEGGDSRADCSELKHVGFGATCDGFGGSASGLNITVRALTGGIVGRDGDVS